MTHDYQTRREVVYTGQDDFTGTPCRVIYLSEWHGPNRRHNAVIVERQDGADAMGVARWRVVDDVGIYTRMAAAACVAAFFGTAAAKPPDTSTPTPAPIADTAPTAYDEEDVARALARCVPIGSYGATILGEAGPIVEPSIHEVDTRKLTVHEMETRKVVVDFDLLQDASEDETSFQDVAPEQR